MNPNEEQQLIEILFDEDSKIMTAWWVTEKDYVSREEIKRGIIGLSIKIKKHAPKYLLSDECNRNFAYFLDIQEWVATTIRDACAEAGVRKYAMVLPNDLIAQLSTEQTREEAGILPFELRYFENKETAHNWLKQS